MASSNDPKDDTGCDLIGTHILDPNGDILLVFNSKDTIVSGPLELHLQTAEAYGADQTQPGSKKRKKSSNSGIEDIEVRVSSRHLSAASPVFAAMLSSKFQEGDKLKKNGAVRIPLPDDPAHGMLVLLNLIYLKSKTVNPSILMQVAMMADKYDMSSMTEVIREKWYNDIKTHIPTVSGDEALQWLAIFDVLAWQDLKTKMLMLVVSHVTDSTSYAGMLSHRPIIASLPLYRRKILKDSIQMLASHFQLYIEDNACPLCSGRSIRCHALRLGLLMIELSRLKLLSYVDTPYPSSINTFKNMLDSLVARMNSRCLDGHFGSHLRIKNDFGKIIAKLHTAASDYEPGTV